MKKVISGSELRDIIKKAIDLICDSVGSTIGPVGNNILLNTSDMSPYITNDGVTIANAIASDDAGINTVLEIIKEASLKTNEVVGDGTTTTLVLLKAIYDEGLKIIDEGISPIELKRKLNNSLDKIIDMIKEKSRKPKKEDYTLIAETSTGDKKMGLFLSDVYNLMGSKYKIRLNESYNDSTYYEIKKGYSIDIDNIPNIYFDNKSEIELNDVNILIIRGYLDDLEVISGIINEGIKNNRNIIILSEEYDDQVLEQVMLYHLELNKNIYLFKIPDYGSRKESILDDISSLSLANVKNIRYENIFFKDLGSINKAIITKNELIIISDNNVDKKIDNLKTEYLKCHDDYEKEFISNRIAKLENGIANIYVGGKTKTEIKERIMRFDDGLCALEMASDGIVIGEGLTLFDISTRLSNDKEDKVLVNALKKPLRKILENTIGNYKEIEDNIVLSDFKKIYNFEKDSFESIDDTSIIDPMNVCIESLKNALSIASLLLTTSCLVINENIECSKDVL